MVPFMFFGEPSAAAGTASFERRMNVFVFVLNVEDAEIEQAVEIVDDALRLGCDGKRGRAHAGEQIAECGPETAVDRAVHVDSRQARCIGGEGGARSLGGVHGHSRLDLASAQLFRPMAAMTSAGTRG